MPGKKANRFKAQTLSGRHGRRWDGYKCEGKCALPGEVCMFAVRLSSSRGDEMNMQKSAEGIVSAEGGEGPNIKLR